MSLKTNTETIIDFYPPGLDHIPAKQLDSTLLQQDAVTDLGRTFSDQQLRLFCCVKLIL